MLSADYQLDGHLEPSRMSPLVMSQREFLDELIEVGRWTLTVRPSSYGLESWDR